MKAPARRWITGDGRAQVVGASANQEVTASVPGYSTRNSDSAQPLIGRQGPCFDGL
jgi:hypothetical protein